MWPQILSTLDPANDSKVSALLVRLRGPHMFAPHLALGVLRTGCEAVRPDASAQDAIKAAVDSMDKVLKFGD